MRRSLFILLFFTAQGIAANKPQSQRELALKSIKQTLPFIFKQNGNKAKIKTKTCSYKKDKWIGLAVGGQAFTEELKFNKLCDLQGKFKVLMNSPFPIELRIKDQVDLKQIDAKVKIQIIIEEEVLLKINITDAVLKRKKDNISFDLAYIASVDIFSKTQFIKEEKLLKLKLKN